VPVFVKWISIQIIEKRHYLQKASSLVRYSVIILQFVLEGLLLVFPFCTCRPRLIINQLPRHGAQQARKKLSGGDRILTLRPSSDTNSLCAVQSKGCIHICQRLSLRLRKIQQSQPSSSDAPVYIQQGFARSLSGKISFLLSITNHQFTQLGQSRQDFEFFHHYFLELQKPRGSRKAPLLSAHLPVPDHAVSRVTSVV